MRDLMNYGLLVLVVLVGNKLGSDFGMGIAFCMFLIIEGLIVRLRKRSIKSIIKKEEVK